MKITIIQEDRDAAAAVTARFGDAGLAERIRQGNCDNDMRVIAFATQRLKREGGLYLG